MTATMEAPPIVTGEIKEAPLGTVTITFPVRALHVVGIAAKEHTRYALDGVHVFGKGGDGVTVEATDGRRALRVVAATGNASEETSVIIPGAIVRAAVKIADPAGPKNKTPRVTVSVGDSECSLSVSSGGGTAAFGWKRGEGEFPRIDSVIPKPAETSTPKIFFNPQLLAGMIAAAGRVLSPDKSFHWSMPDAPSRPIVFETTLGDLSLTGVLMPTLR